MELDYKFNDPKDPQRIYFRVTITILPQRHSYHFLFDGIHNDYHRPTDTPDRSTMTSWPKEQSWSSLQPGIG